jgi:hypothetical protein
MVIQYIIKNTGSNHRSLKFEFSVKTDLSPVWLSEELGIKDSDDRVVMEPRHHFFIANDAANPWYAVWGSTSERIAQSSGKYELPEKTIGLGIVATSEHRILIKSKTTATLTFIITGSAKSQDEAVNAFRYLAENHAMLLEKKKNSTAPSLIAPGLRSPISCCKMYITGSRSIMSGLSVRFRKSAVVWEPGLWNIPGGSAAIILIRSKP